MTDITKKMTKTIWIFLLALTVAGITSCGDEQRSYSELLRDEEKAVNAFLAQQKVLLEVPEDSISFITGKDAPFYKLDPDGYVYMQVIDKGESEKVEAGDKVYFRFSRHSLNDRYNGIESGDDGNSNNLGSILGNTYFLYQNLTGASKDWGTGVQMPMKFFGYGCEVNLVLRSYYGFASDQTSCTAYIINLRYFRPEY